MVRTFKTWFKDNFPEIEIPKGEVPGTWFSEHNLPMVVRCTCCETTMVLFSAVIDDDDYIYCANCRGDELEF